MTFCSLKEKRWDLNVAYVDFFVLMCPWLRVESCASHKKWYCATMGDFSPTSR